ncbi:MAG: ATP-binding protein [Euryarchaeota archaeon]|nr:ATP-binding protein [Euryarchaeota archaeon]
MNCYLTSCFAGFIAFDENFTLLDYELFPKRKLVKKFFQIREGNLTLEEESILKRTVKKCEFVTIETNLNVSKYKNLKESFKFKFEIPSKAGEFLRLNMPDILEKIEFIESEDELKKLTHDLYIEITKYKLKDAAESEDMLLIQAINAIDEIDESTGKLIERLREWYAIHFPELDKIKSHRKYVSLIAEYGDRDSIINSNLLDNLLDLDISEKQSIGAEIQEEDIKIVREFANSIRSLQESKKSLTDYVDNKMNYIAPNLSELVGPSLGAKLIAHIGSIGKLSKLPSSTIQIMGAEKALFRHKKTGERPPKHGLIYQHPEVRGAKWWIRGKVARALASKISLAVRKDVFSGEFDDSIKESFQKKIEEIKKLNPFPKRSERAQKDKRKTKKRKKEKHKRKIKEYHY